jgi:hypothetical protein
MPAKRTSETPIRTAVLLHVLQVIAEQWAACGPLAESQNRRLAPRLVMTISIQRITMCTG